MSEPLKAEIVENGGMVSGETPGQPIRGHETPPASTQLAVIEHGPINLFGADRPEEVIARASSIATALKQMVVKQGLVSTIQGKEYPHVEAWTTLGSMLGVFPVTIWTRHTDDGQGWEARVEARTLAGDIVGAGEAQCTRSERAWASRDDFALRAMSQTRATSRALRQSLGFVMVLAGFEATPSAEIGPISSGDPAAVQGQILRYNACALGSVYSRSWRLSPPDRSIHFQGVAPCTPFVCCWFA
jgi:hypothetical protein